MSEKSDDLFYLAKLARVDGHHDDAMRLYQEIIKRRPDHFEAIFNYSSLLGNCGHYEMAVTQNFLAGKLRKNHVPLLLNRAFLQTEMGFIDTAIDTYLEILQAGAKEKAALLGLGKCYHSIGRYEEAIRVLTRCLEFYPDDLGTLHGLCAAHTASGFYENAILLLDRAIVKYPRSALTWILRADALEKLSRTREAVVNLQQALVIEPNNERALYNLSGLFSSAGMAREAALGFERIRKLNPSFRLTAGNEFHCRLHSCDWSRNSELSSFITLKIEENEVVCAPFDLISICARGELQLINNSNYARARFSQKVIAPRPVDGRGRRRGSKPRVGYISADFRQHAIAQVAVRLFELHDQSNLEIFAFALAPLDQSALAKRIRSAFKSIVDISRLTDQQAVDVIRDAEIDILVDLTGYGRGSRPGILAARPAPVQVNYLGFSATMGAKSHDIIIADEIAIPRSNWKDFSEKVVWMPNSFFVSDDTRPIAPLGRRAEAGLPQEGRVFCNFGSAFKITPEVFDSWMRILRQVDDGVLWLSKMTPLARENLRREARDRYVDPDRLIFAERVADSAEHLGRHSLADIFLDTWPYGAHVTANDALWAGLPVVTWMGDTFASRIAASQLKALGLPELVGTSLAEYEKITVELAKNPHKLSDIKKRLKANKNTEPLFDIHAYVRNFEDVLISIWDMEESGDIPFT
ncbi:protein O-GlcNAc transferase [Agrobacterium pusense]|uniref:tetratricopeptide repeat protein n=1 Tax=Agrobacterium pusense TaxID=648995 RepID=UPI0028552527|nr:tetratricopeptide repeat protein [Agrobacterium pusense]MDR6189637.1 protein O-GlcNAc transferase [Agrobacterium pusense]